MTKCAGEKDITMDIGIIGAGSVCHSTHKTATFDA